MAPSSKTQPVSPYPAESIRLEWHRITLTTLSIWVKLIWVSWLDPLPNHSVKCVMMELRFSHGQYKWIRSWALEITLGLHSMRFGPWSSWWVMGIHGDVWSWWTFVDNLKKKYEGFFLCNVKFSRPWKHFSKGKGQTHVQAWKQKITLKFRTLESRK